ncbi:MAG TPA: hypothetical protein VLU95_02340 [Candidatus Acidoferrum sp.]|nr:hypothetical protein [Candidatus Acidoferrum sp.]
MKPKKKLYCFLLILCLSIAFIGTVGATTESLNIEAGKDYTSKIDLASQDKVQLTFETIGQTSNFSIVFPNSTVLNLGEVSEYSTSFTSDTTGTCELHFDNTNSSDTSLISLNYDVEHYILGMPEMIFVLVAIAVLLMVVVTGYVVMGKYT